ncbi:MAG TPA: hypothetical protein VEL28_06895 [Candidatus Binatia bacterium]|nr:hypothetical protein [Candidatus Binatia bacterium]
MESTREGSRRRLTAEQAFVIHLAGADATQGRAEHVSTGRWAWFGSIAELVGFMRDTMAMPVISSQSGRDADDVCLPSAPAPLPESDPLPDPERTTK